MLIGIGTLFYALATVAELFIAGHLAELLTLRRTQKMIDSLTNHHIVCGFGRVGRQVARDLAAAQDTEKKLKRAGADRVISPYKASGTEMARLALHPQLSGVIDVDVRYRVEGIEVGDTCEAAGRAIDEIRGGSMIVGLRRGEAFHPQPASETVLEVGDVIVAVGTPTALSRLEGLLEQRAR